jgi:hypothetical protein
MKARFLMVLLVGVLLATGCKESPAPQAAKNPVATQPQNSVAVDAKTAALQDFQSFRTATSLAVAVKSLMAMEQKLGAAGLSHRDLSLDDNEIIGRLRDLARRPVRPAKPAAPAHRPRQVHPHHK